jgi:hypothetical protein
VLRRTFDGNTKSAEMHVLYADGTVDEMIYAKEDWADLTGDAQNRYWRWPLGGSIPEALEGPPRTPLPTEEQEWERLGGAPQHPVPWCGALPSREYSVDTRGTVLTRSGAVVSNPQSVAEMVARVRGRPGGRFFVSPIHHLVVIREAGRDGQLWVAGQLEQPFAIRDQDEDDSQVIETAHLGPGDFYAGAADATNGEYRVLQKRGGVIERSLGGGAREFALTDPTSAADQEKIDNARRLLDAWRSVSTSGMKIAVNGAWHAWYLDGGQPKFLASVSGGFAWPTEDARATS